MFFILIVVIPVTTVVGVAFRFFPSLRLHAMDVRLERGFLAAICHGK